MLPHVVLLSILAAVDAAAAPPNVAAAHAGAPEVLFFDMDSAVVAESLDYEEQLVAFVFEGLVNHAAAPHPTVMFDAGYMNFDWPGSDAYWNTWLTGQGRVTFKNVSSATLCGLVAGADPEKRIKGVVLYETDGERQEEWAVPIATTVGAQQQLLPVTKAIIAKHSSCLASLPVVMDLTKNKAMASADSAWAWAFEKLLPQASKTVAFNLYHYEPSIHTDPQSNATLANVDWAVQQKAFIVSIPQHAWISPSSSMHKSQVASSEANPLIVQLNTCVSQMNFKTPTFPNTQINPLFSKALENMDPLFSAYG